uniref:Uncharacterized protein n=1 Tax=Arundo donax TaxID=35708 RepID=A0A0A9DS75_ARUDO
MDYRSINMCKTSDSNGQSSAGLPNWCFISGA